MEGDTARTLAVFKLFDVVGPRSEQTSLTTEVMTRESDGAKLSVHVLQWGPKDGRETLDLFSEALAGWFKGGQSNG